MNRTPLRLLLVLFGIFHVPFVAGADSPATHPAPAVVSTPIPTQGVPGTLREALADWRAEKYDAALKAIDNAEHVGAATADVTALRIWILCRLTEKGMEKWDPKSPESSPPGFDAGTINQRADLMQRALDETVRYRDQKMEDHLSDFVVPNDPEFSYFRNSATIPEVAYIASKLLVLMEISGMKRADDFRLKMRAETNYDPLQGKNGQVISDESLPHHGDLSQTFADDWAATPEEEKAYYRLEFVDSNPSTPDGLLDDPSLTFCARFLTTPEARLEAWNDFVESLRKSPNSQRKALLLKVTSSDPKIANQAYLDYLNYLYARRDWVCSTDVADPVIFDAHIPNAIALANTAAAMPLLHALLKARKPGRCSVDILRMIWQPSQFDPKDAPVLWQEINAYKQRRIDLLVQKEGRPNQAFLSDMETFFGWFRAQFPDVVANTPLPMSPRGPSIGPDFMVTKFWSPYLQASVPANTKGIGTGAYCVADAVDEIFVAAVLDAGPDFQGEIYQVHLPDFATKVIDTVDGKVVPNVEWTPKALYAAAGGEVPQENDRRNQLARYDFASGAWAQHTLPISYAPEEIFPEGDAVYLTSSYFMSPSASSSQLVRYDWFTDKLTVLADSQRRPAHNQFDGCSPWCVINLGHGPGGKLVATFTTGSSSGTGTYYIQQTRGDWKPLFSGFSMYSAHSRDQSLVFDNEGNAVLIDPKLPGPVAWMTSDQPAFRRDITPPLAEGIFDPPPGQQKEMDTSNLTFHDGRLYRLTILDPMTDTYALAVYDKSRGRKPTLIPLKFQLTKADHDALAGHDFGVQFKVDDLMHPAPGFSFEIFATSKGLCLRPIIAGFWFMPYADINAYLKSQPVLR